MSLGQRAEKTVRHKVQSDLFEISMSNAHIKNNNRRAGERDRKPWQNSNEQIVMKAPRKKIMLAITINIDKYS